MSAATTSIAAYREIKRDGTLSAQQARIMAVIAHGMDYSRRELATLAKVELSAVCGRVNELVEDGYLIEGASRPCRITGKTIHPVKRPAEQMELEGL